MSPDLELALAIADLADVVTLRHFRSAHLQVETKPDNSPVSNADREVEELIRARLAVERPADSVDGEEFGSGTQGPRRWILDPIDGTRNYVRGIPVWATLVALVVDDEPVVGVVSAPAMSARWWGSRGEGAFSRDGPLRVSRVASHADASVGHGHLDAFRLTGTLDAFLGLAAEVYQPRGLGDFWQHVLVAAGQLDACVDPICSAWDIAAIAVIVEEAGGRFTDLGGARSIHGGNAVSSNGLVHDHVLRSMRRGAADPD